MRAAEPLVASSGGAERQSSRLGMLLYSPLLGTVEYLDRLVTVRALRKSYSLDREN